MLTQLLNFIEGSRAVGERADIGIVWVSVNRFFMLYAMSLQFKRPLATLVGANEWPHIKLRKLVMKVTYMRL
jgi:hypothetical protein